METSQTSEFPPNTNPKHTAPETIPDGEVRENSPEKPEGDEFSETELLNQGIQAMDSNQFEQAVEKFSLALKLAVNRHGELHDEIYTYYYKYADSLLRAYETEQEQSGELFGEAVPQEICYTDDEPEEAPAMKQDAENPEDPPQEEVPQQEDQEQSEDENEEEEGEEENGDQENQTPEEDQEEAGDDLQYAWENFEMARLILERTKQDNDLLYNVYLNLGTVQNWKENYAEAITEYTKALDMLYTIEGENYSRNKAEVFFRIGNAHLNIPGNEQQSNHNFTQALCQLEGYKQTMTDQEEAELVSMLIKEISLKREDAIEQEQSLSQIRNDALNMPKLGLDQATVPEDQVQDLGVLGKRKREEDGTEGEKKFKETD